MKILFWIAATWCVTGQLIVSCMTTKKRPAPTRPEVTKIAIDFKGDGKVEATKTLANGATEVYESNAGDTMIISLRKDGALPDSLIKPQP